MRRSAVVFATCLFVAAPAAAQVSLLAAREYSLGAVNNAHGLAAGDFNGDGRGDVATIVDPNVVEIMLGDGTGALALSASFTAQDRPADLAAGDFNGDARLDLAVANSGSSNLTIALGNGDGSFTIANAVPAGLYPIKVVVADVDRDGRQDLVVANAGAGNVMVMRGAGDGTFAPGVAYAVGVEPRDVVTGAFNGDAYPDLAVVNRRSNTVSLLSNRGDGTFADAGTIAVGFAPAFLKTADLNGDARLDLAVGDQQTLWTLLGNGDGTFSAPRSAATVAAGFDLADFNRDGAIDLVATNTNTGQLSVSVGGGDGTFALKQRYGLHQNVRQVVATDLNGDGRVDLVSPAPTLAATVAVLIGAGDGGFMAARAISPGATTTGEVAIGDINHDGIADLVTVGSMNICVRLGIGAGAFGVPRVYRVGGESVVLRDVNHDGNIDVITEIAVLLGTGTGTLLAPIPLPSVPGAVFSTDIAVADFNEDGTLDIVLAATSGTVLLIGNGDGTFTMTSAVSYESMFVTAADFNGDGHMDVVVDYPDSYPIEMQMVLLGNGNGTFRGARSIIVSDHWARPRVADFNEDGIPDLLVSQASSDPAVPSRVAIAAGNGDGTFRLQFSVEMQPVVRGVATSDFDGDGHQDLVYQLDTVLHVAAGNGNGTFQPETMYGAGTPNTIGKLTIGDYDNDGRSDLVSSSYATLTLLKNISR